MYLYVLYKVSKSVIFVRFAKRTRKNKRIFRPSRRALFRRERNVPRTTNEVSTLYFFTIFVSICTMRIFVVILKKIISPRRVRLYCRSTSFLFVDVELTMKKKMFSRYRHIFFILQKYIIQQKLVLV